MSRTNDILVIGDVMLDQYVSGSTDRLSPEAPVPVVKIDSQFSVLGGAANVANNLAALGANVSLLGVVGRDDNARIVNELLEAKGIANQLLDEDIFTTVKTRVISRNQQMVRVDREEVFSDEDAFVNHLSGVLSFFQGSAIIVSDYAKGVCSPGAMKVILTWATKTFDLGYFHFHFPSFRPSCEAAQHGFWYEFYGRSKKPLGSDRGSVGLAKNKFYRAFRAHATAACS